jgi:hypothetical protein
MKDTMILPEEKLWNDYYINVWRNVPNNILDMIFFIGLDNINTNVNRNVKFNVKNNLKMPSENQFNNAYNILELL